MTASKFFTFCALLITIVMLGVYHDDFAAHNASVEDEYINHKHRILYLDRQLGDEDKLIMISAALEWMQRTKYTVIIDVVYLPTYDKIDSVNGIIVNEYSPDHPDIIMLDNIKKNIIVGFYTSQDSMPHIAIVGERLTLDSEYKTTFLHELGHALGLEHNEGIEGMGTLMYPSLDGGGADITEQDLVNFCKIYRCNATQLSN